MYFYGSLSKNLFFKITIIFITAVVKNLLSLDKDTGNLQAVKSVFI